MGPGLLNKYIWLIQKLIVAGEGGKSLGEISEAWHNRFGTEYPRRTFNNHREAIESVFGITIECDRSTNRYLIRHGEDAIDSDSGTAWIIDTFTVSNILSLGKERLSGRVSVETIPSGKKFLVPLMGAMQDNSILSMTYKRYGEQNPEKVRIRPYAVKESAQRWYLIGYSEERESCRVYALDRIQSLEILKEKFRMPENFDVDGLFATSFGTYLSDTPGKTIIFKAYGKEASYIRDLPLHHSQEEITGTNSGWHHEGDAADKTETGADKEGSATFRIFVSPNTSLYLEFLGHGPNLEVLSPPEVREKLAEMARATASRYTSTTNPAK